MAVIRSAICRYRFFVMPRLKSRAFVQFPRRSCNQTLSVKSACRDCTFAKTFVRKRQVRDGDGGVSRGKNRNYVEENRAAKFPILESSFETRPTLLHRGAVFASVLRISILVHPRFTKPRLLTES